MRDVKTYKVLSTENFRTLAGDSIMKGYNRLPSDELLDMLDPEGTHVLIFSMPHEYIAGKRVDMHFRTLWLMKVEGSDEPVEVYMDMTWDNYNAIPDRERSALDHTKPSTSAEGSPQTTGSREEILGSETGK